MPNFGVGAWAWGDRLFWGYDEKQDLELREGGDIDFVRNQSQVFCKETGGSLPRIQRAPKWMLKGLDMFCFLLLVLVS